MASRGLLKRTGLPSSDDLARVRVVQPVEDVHQAGLARAVLAHQREQLARADVERHVIQRRDAAEPLGDVTEGDQGVRLEGESSSMVAGTLSSPEMMRWRSASTFWSASALPGKSTRTSA